VRGWWSPVQSRTMARMALGATAPSASRTSRWSWERRVRGGVTAR